MIFILYSFSIHSRKLCSTTSVSTLLDDSTVLPIENWDPHLPQNEELSGFDVPHFEQTDARFFPQLLQNFEVFGFCRPQLGQGIPPR